MLVEFQVKELNIIYARIGQSEMILSKKNTTTYTNHKSLDIKLGLFKQFVKALDKESSAFAYLAEKIIS